MPVDFGKALLWYRKSAEQGNARAQNALAAIYAQGKGTAQDYKQANYWYRQSAAQGNAGGLLDLALYYQDGLHLTQHEVATYALYTLSIMADDSPSNLAKRFRDELIKKLPDTAIEEGNELVDKMLEPNNLLKALDEYLAKHSEK